MPPYTRFYNKRVQQQFPSSQQMTVSRLLQSEFKKLPNGHKIKFHCTILRLKSIRDNQLSARDSLRSSIQSRMSASTISRQHQIKEQQNKAIKNSEDRKRKLDKIKSMEQNLFDKTFNQTKAFQRQTEEYFKEKSQEKSINCYSDRMKKFSVHKQKINPEQCTKNHDLKHRKQLPKILRVSANQLKKKLEIRKQIENQKYKNNLNQYLDTLKRVQKIREDKIKKIISGKNNKKQDIYYKIPIKTQLNLKCKRRLDGIKAIIEQKHTFKQTFSRSIEQKYSLFEIKSKKKQNLLKNRSLSTKPVPKLKRFVQQTMNEVQRRINFQFMQNCRKILNK